MELEFIQELTEARLFRNRDTLNGRSARNIADICFLALLAMEILRTLDSSYAKKYSNDTLSYGQFKTMRNNATDLHNLLAVLNNQSEYAGKMQPDLTISVPVLQIRRYLRDLDNDRKDKPVDRQFFYKLQSFLKITNGEYKELRRAIVDWRFNSAVEKRNIIRTIKNEFNRMTLQLDLQQHFKKLSIN